jgi:outer membrane receptor protein involved in Fe transport
MTTPKLAFMKSGIHILTLIFVVFASVSYSQTVTLSGKDIPLKKVFRAIKLQTGYVFFYDATLLKEVKPVTLELMNASIQGALEQIFRDQSFDWLIENKSITLYRKPVRQGVQPQPSSPNQTVIITGVIKDPEGQPIQGASVIVRETGKGTSTNESGSFTIEASKGNVLVISSVSYLQTQVVADRRSLLIQLEPDLKPMEKLVIGGNIVPIKRKAEVASVGIIDSKTLENVPFQNIDQVFRGVIAGTNNIQPGYETYQYSYGSGTVSIRGAVGFEGYGLVKVYVDGVQFPTGSYFLNALDKNNIDHIEVVKGPSASTLYGSGASGGVILIYTKKPMLNSTQINITSSAGWYDSKWEDKKPFRQLHAFNISKGFKNVSFIIGADINSYETYNPGGTQNRCSFYGGVTYTRKNLKISLNGQFYDNDYKPERNPFWDSSSNAYFNKPGFKLPDSVRGSLKSNGLSANVGYKANKWWTHNLVLGWFDNSHSRESFLKNPTLLSAKSGYKGPSLRYYNEIRIKPNSQFRLNLLSGVEYVNFLSDFFAVIKSRSEFIYTRIDTADLQKNAGVFAQLNPSYKDKIFLTISGRYDFNKTFGAVFNPRIGATTNFQLGMFTLKPRIAWGKGINLISYSTITNLPPNFLPNPDLKPPQQNGWDYGLEGYLEGSALSFEISRFDYSLISGITAIEIAPAPNPQFQYRNTGKVTNDGWEFSAHYKLKNFKVTGNYSITNSILREPLSGQVSPKDLTYPGEQMMFIPKHAAGLMIAYVFPKLFGLSDQLNISSQATYTGGAYTIDRVKSTYEINIYRDLSNFNNYGRRYYKTKQPSKTMINLNLDYNIMKELRIFMQVENLANNTSPDYTNAFPITGRGWMFGLKYSFNRIAP